jgi:hypothetical protein
MDIHTNVTTVIIVLGFRGRSSVWIFGFRVLAAPIVYSFQMFRRTLPCHLHGDKNGWGIGCDWPDWSTARPGSYASRSSAPSHLMPHALPGPRTGLVGHNQYTATVKMASAVFAETFNKCRQSTYTWHLKLWVTNVTIFRHFPFHHLPLFLLSPFSFNASCVAQSYRSWPTTKKTQHVSVTNTRWLRLFREITVACFKDRKYP